MGRKMAETFASPAPVSYYSVLPMSGTPGVGLVIVAQEDMKVGKNNFIKHIIKNLKCTFLAKRNTEVNVSFPEWGDS